MARRARQSVPLFLAHVAGGLEDVAAEEIAERLPDARIDRIIRRFDERTGVLLFRYPGATQNLLELRTVEDVFVLVVDTGSVPTGRVGLRVIRDAVLNAKDLEGQTGLALRTRPRRKGRPTFRVISRKSGNHVYRRVDVQRAVEAAIKERFPSWRLVEDDAGLEVWVQLIGDRLLVGIRLSDSDLRQRTWRTVSLPAALKPTIAAAMVRLSDPAGDDVFLDPMCGSGTIVIERALAGRYRLLLAGDIAPDAVQATRQNVGPRYKPIEIRQWDACDLPLEAASCSALACNLPFGKQIGSVEENRILYPALLQEWVRVLAPGSRMVLLSGDRAALRDAVQRRADLHEERKLPVLVRGFPAEIRVLRRR